MVEAIMHREMGFYWDEYEVWSQNHTSYGKHEKISHLEVANAKLYNHLASLHILCMYIVELIVS